MKITAYRSIKFLLPSLLLAIFALFTFLVKTFNVEAIGPEGSKVGFARLNGAIADIFPYNSAFYEISEFTGLELLLVVVVFAGIGLMQLAKGRSVKAVDKKIIILGAYYAVVFALYVLFDKMALNFRPVIIDVSEGLEPSYPSSHTMLAVCVAGSALMLVDSYLRNAKCALTVKIVLIVIGALTVIARTLSGVHWFTDIIGALLISAALVTLYGALIEIPDSSGDMR